MKTCFKCSRTLPLSDFYSHPAMADGHLGKCKNCTKADTAARVKVKSLDPAWMEKEIERHRLKQQRRRQQGRDRKLTREKKRQVAKAHAARYPERHRARMVLGGAVRAGTVSRQPCSVCGVTDSEAHHDDYSKPLAVTWLCPAHHAERHREIRRQARAASFSTR